MKKTLIASLLAFVLFSCRKDISVPPGMENLFGEWEWVSSTGGIIGATTTPDSQKETSLLKFDKKGKHKRIKNGKKEIKTHFTLNTTTDPNGATITYIDYETNTLRDQIVYFDGNDKLILKDQCNDCYTSVYKRK